MSKTNPLSYLVAKGGITSHDILIRGLEVEKARVLGQILPGVSVISLPVKTKFGGRDSPASMSYIIFPGNVGDEDALLNVFQILNHVKSKK